MLLYHYYQRNYGSVELIQKTGKKNNTPFLYVKQKLASYAWRLLKDSNLKKFLDDASCVGQNSTKNSMLKQVGCDGASRAPGRVCNAGKLPVVNLDVQNYAC